MFLSTNMVLWTALLWTGVVLLLNKIKVTFSISMFIPTIC